MLSSLCCGAAPLRRMTFDRCFGDLLLGREERTVAERVSRDVRVSFCPFSDGVMHGVLK